MNLEKNFVKCVCIKGCDLLTYSWQRFGNKKPVSQNKICKTNKLQAISPQELNKIV